jgi:RNA polymerase sigma-70 factor (ECF subfamily)
LKEEFSETAVEASDDHLMYLVKKGDSAGFSALMDRYYHPIRSFMYQLISDTTYAEDLTQEVFLRLHSNAYTYKKEGSFKPWIYSIAHNIAMNFLRRKGIERNAFRSMTLSYSTPSKDKNPAETEEMQTVIKNALSMLDCKYRTPLVLCVLQGLSYQEASKALGCSVKTLSVRLARAKQQFAKIVTPYIEGGTYGRVQI